MAQKIDWSGLDQVVSTIINMEAKLTFFLVIILVLCICTPVLGDAACQSIPLSVSDVSKCSNGICNMDVIATGALDLINGKTQCVDLMVGDSGSKVSSINITLLNAYATQQVDYCYYTDDVLYDTKCVCGCAWDYQAVCNSGSKCDRAIPKYDRNIVCGGGAQSDSICALYLTEPGTYCYRTGFSGLRRFKVCKMKPKELIKATLVIDTPTEQLFFNHDVKQSVHLSSSGAVNFTVVNPAFQARDDVQFIVVDLLNPTYLFVGDSSIVNDIANYDMKKIGWYKVGSANEISLTTTAQSIVVNLMKCGHTAAETTFNVYYDWLMPGAILANNQNKFAKTSLPGAFFDDNEFQTAKRNKVPDILGQGDIFWELKEGFFGYKYIQTGSLSLVGVDYEGRYIPTQYTVSKTDLTVATNKKRMMVAKWNLHCSEAWLDGDTSPCSQVCLAESSLYPGEYGFCYKKTCGSESPICDAFSIRAMNWPSNQWVDYGFMDGRMIIGYAPTDNSQSTLFYPVLGANMLYTLTMRNMSVRFTSSDVKPNIVSCKQTDTDIELVMKTDAADGNVLLTAVPGIYPTQIHYLKSTPQTFSYPLSKNMTGNFTMLARNADFSVSCNLQVSFATAYEYNITWTNITGLPQNLLGLITGVSSPFMSTLSEVIFWICLVSGIIVVIIVVIAIAVGIFFLFPYIFPFISCCCSCCKTTTKGWKKVGNTVTATQVKKESNSSTEPTEPEIESAKQK